MASSAKDEWKERWPLVLGAMLGYSCLSLQVFLFGVFVLPIEQELHWSRAEVMLGLSVMHAAGIALNLGGGLLVDRFGARRVALTGQVLTCAGFSLLSTANGALGPWLANWLLIAVGGALMQGMAWTRIVAQHFDKGRGLAIATVLTGSSITATFAPLVATWLIGLIGWRAALAVSPLMWLAITFPFSFGLFRSAHKTMGTRPANAGVSDADQPGVTLRQALRMPAFWCIGAALFAFALYTVALAPNLIPLLREKGVDGGLAAKLAALVGFSGLVARLSVGHLLDRLPSHLVAGACYVMPMVGLALTLDPAPSSAMLALSIILLGASIGAELDVIVFLTTRHFGIRHFGAILGAILGFGAIGSMIAPIAMGRSHDIFGMYDPFLMLLLVVLGVMAILMFCLRDPRSAPGESLPCERNG